ncbi:phosphotransferase family protein [Mycolicibacterium goodii]|uniref:choline/ethanolamine kinase family protein n=1 Tax=Mycolicibacterium goodii TaxID=134601 RepID=UPI001BDBC791|nr:choline/ethanolamine kinase family protein [Mycolicibacterium goodii]MBU8811529.1 phosphotransferase family protein [Mycolicibacterium goodii]ULN46214.1 phosphotransferase family protein [Mycolicibacterium goodii]
MTAPETMPDGSGNRVLGTARTEAERRVERVLASIVPWQRCSMGYAPVAGGLSNSNWRISVDGSDRRYFLKIPGEGTDEFVDRAVANEAARRAGELGIGPEVVYFDQDTGVEVIEFLEGYRACTNGDFKDPDVPRQIVDIYRILHGGNLLSTTKTVFDMIDEHLEGVAEHGVRLPADFELMLAEYQVAKSALLASGLELVACHNDPMPGNFLVAHGKPMKMVDFEFASNNERAYELAVLTTEMFYGEQLTMELIEEFYGSFDFAKAARVQVCGALADVKWGLWACLKQKLNTEWSFDYHKYGCWKLARARLKMSDPRWPFWLKAL